jgi:hypothetical protein
MAQLLGIRIGPYNAASRFAVPALSQLGSELLVMGPHKDQCSLSDDEDEPVSGKLVAANTSDLMAFLGWQWIDTVGRSFSHSLAMAVVPFKAMINGGIINLHDSACIISRIGLRPGAAFTCRFTAALRHVEGRTVPHPVLVDPIAPHLCGRRALRLAEAELAALAAAQPTECLTRFKHLRVPARAALIDLALLRHLRAIAQHRSYHDHGSGAPLHQGAGREKGRLQVVSLGCGMDTRPWRLRPDQQHRTNTCDGDSST